MMNSRKICGMLCAIALAAASPPGDADASPQGAAVAPSATVPEHYQLQRRVIRVELQHNPLVRVQCTLRDVRGVSETLVWDPAERRGLTRYALLPTSKQPTRDVLECVSDRLDLEDGAGSFAYIFKRSDKETDAKKEVSGTWKSITDSTEKNGEAIKLGVTATDVEAYGDAKEKAGDTAAKDAADAEKLSVLGQLGGFEETTSLRSLDPTTMLVNDLLGTLATIALDRASEAGKQYVRRFLQDHLCKALTVENIVELLDKQPLAKALQDLDWRPEQPLLQTTCALIDTARIDELASARDAVWRAVAIDATALAGIILEGSIEKLMASKPNATEVKKALVKIARATGDLMRVMIAGNTATTERDVQMLILALGRVGFDSQVQQSWRCGLEGGVAVLRDCLRDQTCSADELQRLLEQERRLSKESGSSCDLGGAIDKWAELPTLLGRMADVLRPAPGIDARMTAATAFELVLDVMEHVIEQEAKTAKEAELRDTTRESRRNEVHPDTDRYAYTAAMIRTLRAVVAVVRGEDPAPAIVELAKVLELAILNQCATREVKSAPCPVPVNTKNLQRAFAVVSALASYGASYRGDASGDDVPAELQTQRAEERKLALETVIDAFTDRSQRENEWVPSIGANVALGLQLRATGHAAMFSERVNRNFLSLPMGLAYHQLPGSDNWNPHFMLTVIDLAQYVTVSEDGTEIEAPKPELTTALRLGGEIGLLFGEPSFPIAVTVHAAWIPRITYEGDVESRNERRYGVSVGVFVPFLDLN